MKQAALVTGAGRGIGRGIAVALGRLGWSICINYRSNQRAAETTLKMVQDAGGSGMCIGADIADAHDRKRLVDEFLAAFGRHDLLVNNAGMAPRQRLDLLETTEANFDEVMAVNLKGPFFLTQRVAREMLRLMQSGVQKTAKIINIGSISAFASSTNRAEYCISKAGLSMMTTLFADRLADAGIQVFEIRPGIIETEMTGAAKDKYDRLIAGGLTPIRRWGQPEDVARAVVAIVQDQLPFSTGEIIHVDGGFHLRKL